MVRHLVPKGDAALQQIVVGLRPCLSAPSKETPKASCTSSSLLRRAFFMMDSGVRSGSTAGAHPVSSKNASKEQTIFFMKIPPKNFSIYSPNYVTIFLNFEHNLSYSVHIKAVFARQRN